jgi:hypothetical protein
MIKKNIYDYFRLYIIRPFCVLLESVCGFMEGIENFETVIVICDDTHLNNKKFSQNNHNRKNISTHSSDISEHSDSDYTSEHTDSEHTDSEHTDSEHSDSEHNDSEHNNSEHNDSEHNDSEHNNSEHSDSEHNKFKNKNLDIEKDTHREENKQKDDNDIESIELDSLDEEINDTIKSHTPSLKMNNTCSPDIVNTDSESSFQKARRRRRMPIRLARRRYNNM